jgi:hypothetical protein
VSTLTVTKVCFINCFLYLCWLCLLFANFERTDSGSDSEEIVLQNILEATEVV